MACFMTPILHGPRGRVNLPLLLEVIVQTVADARAAAAGGANRLEVVREIERGGLTPSLDLVRAISAAVELPLRVMVRETDGFAVAHDGELARLQDAFAALAGLGVDGAVVGFARGGELDLETTAAVLAAAPALHATFHRAFDQALDPCQAIAALRTFPQVDRVLTTGGEGDWHARARQLERYASLAGPTLSVLAGGNLDSDGLRILSASKSVREGHVGRAACDPPVPGAPVSEERVRHLKAAAAGT